MVFDVILRHPEALNDFVTNTLKLLKRINNNPTTRNVTKRG